MHMLQKAFHSIVPTSTGDGILNGHLQYLHYDEVCHVLVDLADKHYFKKHQDRHIVNCACNWIAQYEYESAKVPVYGSYMDKSEVANHLNKHML
uniref:Uncharacterized protein n=1 Tax=Moniliophthora roreri TaxID=221103 RepID=A0A0W0EVV2_MONRR